MILQQKNVFRRERIRVVRELSTTFTCLKGLKQN